MDGKCEPASNCLKDILAKADDDVSVTSSNMSDDASWTSEESQDESGDENDAMSMADISRSQQQPCLIRANRSTASLNAMKESNPLVVADADMQQQHSTLSKAKSMQSLMSAANAASTSRPAPMSAIQRVSAQDCTPGSHDHGLQPDKYLCNILNTQLDQVPYHSLGGYFLTPTPEQIAAWDHDLLRAIRTHDLPLIQRMHQDQGKPLQASNQFGESIMHVCVRRGNLKILKYLLSQGVTPKVHCDYGRTPLHDALWTMNNPESLKMAAMLISRFPEMLLVTDKRGFTPLNYVPRDRWSYICRFLDRCLPMLQRLRNNGRKQQTGQQKSA